MTERLLRLVDAAEPTRAGRSAVAAETLDAARVIVDDVRANGEPALRAHAERLGDLQPGAPWFVGRDALDAALASLPAADRGVLERCAARVAAFADAQRASVRDIDVEVPGGRAGHTVRPVAAAGCYAPGGPFPLPSYVHMTAVTARRAGVGHVWVASPRPTQTTLAAAAIAGADGLIALGGAHAIAALAYGVAPVPPCDVVCGPGSRWVTAAKQLVSGDVRIDMLAGPSELLIIADSTADPAVVAADLLAQAEHDPDAVPMLVTTYPPLVDAVETELAFQLADLPTAATASAALENGWVTVVASLDDAVALSNRVAPEHLQVLTANAADVARRCVAYGAVFVGAQSAEVLGDYGAGPNHTLPTGGTARFVGGLSVFDFLAIRTWLALDAPDALARDATALARLEGLEAHARAAELRLSPR